VDPLTVVLEQTEGSPAAVQEPPHDIVSLNDDSSTLETVALTDNAVSTKRTRTANRQLNEYQTYAMKTSMPDTPRNDIPINQALQSAEGEEWWTAIMAELDGLYKLEVGFEILFENIPPSCRILDTKFILKNKKNALNVITKKKARLVVFGNREQLDSDTNLFSPTANDKSVKLFFALCAYLGLKIIGYDVYLAFLYAFTPRDIVVRLPKQILKDNQRIYWKLNKTLYGLKDSPRIFNQELTALLLSGLFRQSCGDPCIFFKGNIREESFILAVVIVDDLSAGSKSPNAILQLRLLLSSKYTITESASIESFVGIHVSYNRDNSITLSMPGQISKLCSKYLTEADAPLDTPMISNFDDDFQNDSPLCDPEDYNRRIGELIFILKVRIDICFSISRLAHRRVQPTIRDIAATKHMYRYLLGTLNHGITYHMSTNNNKFVLQLMTWVDAAFNVYHDGKSQIGFCLSLGPDTGMLYASSAKTKTVPLSSTEAEADAMVELTKNVIWYYMVLKEIGFDTSNPATVFEDNGSLISLVKHYSGNHKRVKHFLLQINFLIESANNRIIAPVKIPGPDNCADMLTKPKGFTAFQPQKEQILGKRII
jgi:histone deacetylase 1/2